MSATLTQDTKVRAGSRADAILGDPVFVQAMDRLEAEWVGKWRKGKTVEEREHAHFMLKAAEEIRHQLGMIVGDGELAKAVTRRITQ